MRPSLCSSLLVIGLLGCETPTVVDDDGSETTSPGDESGDGDGDGDEGDGDGDGDGDEGDGDEGDGDGDGDEGEGDGDGDGDSPPICGNGVIEGDEHCDTNNIDTPTCDNDCTEPLCGDGNINTAAGELCDDANDVDDDDCSNSCVPSSCGDGVRTWPEQCDDGNDIDDDVCANNCFYNLHPLCSETHAILSVDTRLSVFNDGPGGVQLCDRSDAPNKSPDWQGPGWYRFGEGNFELIEIFPPTDYACGGTSGGWLMGGLPNVADGIVESQLCFAFADDTCASSVMVQALNCWEFSLYQLPEAPACDLRYCATSIIPP